MQHFLWGKLVLVLVAVVAVLQAEAAFATLVRSLHQGRVLDTSGEYQLVPNLAPGTQQPAPRAPSTVPDIALVSQCSFNHLHYIVPMVQRWQGPVSVAVFAEDHELSEALWAIAGLRLCYSAIRHNVSFQLVSPLPAGGRPPLTVPPDPYPPCQVLIPDSNQQKNNYAGKRRFPNNLLRNVARRGTSAEFVLVVDIDMLPSFNLRQKEPPSTGLAPLFEVLWKDPWEPFYISRNSVPFYDERFKQYGFNRISQVCELHVAGYKFSVLNNAFLVHRGLKTSTSFHESKDLDQERNRLLFRQFKTELREKYPESSRRCY
ncbi:Beta-1 [Blattella germanica]|nr:Beta-1 [Blattella germanica]